MGLQQYAARHRTVWAARWDCTEGTTEDVRRLVALAGGKVEFKPKGGRLVVIVWLGDIRREFDKVGVLVAPARRHMGDRAVLLWRWENTFAAEFELVEPLKDFQTWQAPVQAVGNVSRETPQLLLGMAHIAVEGSGECPSCGCPVSRFDLEPCRG